LPDSASNPRPSKAAADFDNAAVFDLLRGVAFLTGSDLVADLARTVADAPRADLAIAFNHKQIASKVWLRDRLAEAAAAPLGRVLVCGGWYGILSALLLNDARLGVTHAASLDLDASCAPVAMVLNRRHAEAGRFSAVSEDMYAFDYHAAVPFDWIINTSCEHIGDLRGWLDRLPPAQSVVLQSNDYRREPDHIACVDDLEAFRRQAGLSAIHWQGQLRQRNYTRFMLIGRS
jgi:hypothetical protein